MKSLSSYFTYRRSPFALYATWNIDGACDSSLIILSRQFLELTVMKLL